MNMTCYGCQAWRRDLGVALLSCRVSLGLLLEVFISSAVENSSQLPAKRFSQCNEGKKSRKGEERFFSHSLFLPLE